MGNVRGRERGAWGKGRREVLRGGVFYGTEVVLCLTYFFFISVPCRRWAWRVVAKESTRSGYSKSNLNNKYRERQIDGRYSYMRKVCLHDVGKIRE